MWTVVFDVNDSRLINKQKLSLNDTKVFHRVLVKNTHKTFKEWYFIVS